MAATIISPSISTYVAKEIECFFEDGISHKHTKVRQYCFYAGVKKWINTLIDETYDRFVFNPGGSSSVVPFAIQLYGPLTM